MAIRLIDDPAALAEAAQVWRRIRARRLAAEAETSPGPAPVHLPAGPGDTLVRWYRCSCGHRWTAGHQPDRCPRCHEEMAA